ncbi:hypothetical protein KY342_01400 [Candidatus Woesearchaeota archaeon]|nr:hypothetical protein [Candidatus Woesearchaeota archaeon]
MGKTYKSLRPDTVPTEAVSHEDATLILLQRKVRTALDDLVGKQAYEASQRIKEYTHSEEDLSLYLKKTAQVFIIDDDLADSASKIIVADLKKCIKDSLKPDTTKSPPVETTYSIAVRKVKEMDAKYSPLDLTQTLEENLNCGNKYSPSFPGLLTILWALKMHRPKTYQISLHATKWSDTIGEAINSYNSKNDISQSVEREKLFVYSIAQNLGVLSHRVPNIESDKALTDTKEVMLLNNSIETKRIMYDVGFPESQLLEDVIGHIEFPSSYTGKEFNYDWATATFIGAIAAARQFEGRFYERKHRKKRFTVNQVFEDIGKLFFTPKEIVEVKKIINRGYKYNEEQAWKYPLLQSYAMLNLLVGTLDKECK